jgi:hypothetical protein
MVSPCRRPAVSLAVTFSPSTRRENCGAIARELHDDASEALFAVTVEHIRVERLFYLKRLTAVGEQLAFPFRPFNAGELRRV